ncbi:hypothetical protein [Sinisalibacter aestuarii]|uniref:hypothetical protein n=1 Tax=Sinisalibacter aestuarii TaxID=2949426 RepID=UPI00249398D3|nr:hypothetical protein [Sinisalibacter aestuarii]
MPPSAGRADPKEPEKRLAAKHERPDRHAGMSFQEGLSMAADQLKTLAEAM